MKISEDQGDTDVPPEAIKQIQQFKNSLYDSLKSYFSCQSGRVPEAKTLESDLYARLQIPAPVTSPKEAPFDINDSGPWTGLYLGSVEIRVQNVQDSRRLVAILTKFGIPYGDDAELDVFGPDTGGVWSPLIHFTSRPYNSIAGAFHAFDYRISPNDSKGKWFVVATHINPWPTSCWQDLFVDAVTPEGLGFENELFHDEQYGYVCDEIPPYIRSMSADEFQIRFAISSIDESQGSSVSVMTYRASADEVMRVQPVASNPVNFADEWTRRTWRDSQGWSAPGNLPRLRNQHTKLHGRAFGDFVAWRKCATASLSEVEFAASDDKDVPNYFFLVKRGADRFTMLRVTNRATATCKGRDRLAETGER